MANRTTYLLRNLLHLIWLLTVTNIAIAQNGINLPEVPNPPRLVNDFTGTLQAATIEELEFQLNKFNDSTGNEIAVVLVNSLDGHDISDYAYYLARKWQIGKAKNDNGVLLLVAKQDKKVRIEVGSGLEGALPDLLAKEIIRVDISPNFQNGDFDQGIKAAVKSITQATQHEYDQLPVNTESSGSLLPVLAILFLALLLMMLMMRARRAQGQYMSRRGYRDWDVHPGGGWWINTGGWNDSGGGFFDGGGGFSGGGGFGGFGGGGFGGGGASGDW